MSASDTPKIPDKLYFRITDVAEITGLQPYILRYWESEFPMLRPDRDEKGERRYRKSDIELILQIKKLVYEEKYTLAGARKQLKAMRRSGGALPSPEAANAPEASTSSPPPSGIDRERLRELTSRIEEVRTQLTELYRMFGH